jgi:hypothetical protein
LVAVILTPAACILGHGGSFLLTWLRLATSSSARFGAASPSQLCERNRTSSSRLSLHQSGEGSLRERKAMNRITLPQLSKQIALVLRKLEGK